MVKKGKWPDTALFHGMTGEELDALMMCLAPRDRHYSKGDTVFYSGDAIHQVGLVATGRLHVVREDFMGNQTIVTELEEGDLFGEVFAFAHTPNLPVSIIAVEDSYVWMIDYQRIIGSCPRACSFHHRLIENMLGILASKNVLLNQKIEVLSQRSTRDKLVAYLSTQARKTGRRAFEIPFNRQQLADFLCVDRSAMSAELSRMQAEGLIHTRKSFFELYGLVE